MWGATEHGGHPRPPVRGISIHAPRVGSDMEYNKSRPYKHDFNPRSPCGERPERIRDFLSDFVISIHAPRVGSDIGAARVHVRPRTISIHAPRVGSDGSSGDFARFQRNFNPRSPCGERRLLPCAYLLFEIFQSTLPVWGATCIAH